MTDLRLIDRSIADERVSLNALPAEAQVEDEAIKQFILKA
jgi:hypothetical protein